MDFFFIAVGKDFHRIWFALPGQQFLGLLFGQTFSLNGQIRLHDFLHTPGNLLNLNIVNGFIQKLTVGAVGQGVFDHQTAFREQVLARFEQQERSTAAINFQTGFRI